MSAEKIVGLVTAVGTAFASAIHYKRNRDTEMELRERIVRLESELSNLREKLAKCESTSQT